MSIGELPDARKEADFQAENNQYGPHCTAASRRDLVAHPLARLLKASFQ
jgi:hypothetical protein